MGRRRVSDTADDSAQYYCLIPRGKGFPPTSVPMTEDGRDGTSYTAQAEHWRHELIEAYGYTTKRVNEEATQEQKGKENPSAQHPETII